ncbi:MAG: hypothetical protein EPO23_03195 [Xanthobacteraceae bacterium]|nr:MAG: hypothetical protein EPO23_03195 [Xanthobacteraceae bacterium]
MKFLSAPLGAALSLMSFALLAVSILVTSAAPAHALDLGAAYASWHDLIAAVASALIIGLIGIVLELIRRKMGLSIEDSQRDALQTALTNAAGLALNALGHKLEGKTITISNPAIDQALTYVIQAAPAAIAKFGLSDEQLREKIIAKLALVAPAPAAAK